MCRTVDRSREESNSRYDVLDCSEPTTCESPGGLYTLTRGSLWSSSIAMGAIGSSGMTTPRRS